MSVPDRLEELKKQSVFTGLDFVYVHEDQVKLDVHFLRAPATLDEPMVPNGGAVRELELHNIEISGTSGERFPISQFDWVNIDADYVLRLTTPFPGGFEPYTLTIKDDRLDPYYNSLLFNFKANCESDLDCKESPSSISYEEVVDFPVVYNARDFWSMRQALLEFASQRYPNWHDRLEADAGVMLVEVLSALGDELAYFQDRIAREAYFETATQRRSLRRHARLVDYDIHEGLAAFTWLDITVKPGNENKFVSASTDIWATSDSASRSETTSAAEQTKQARSIYFEIGHGLAESLANTSYSVDWRRNSFNPHIWDEDATSLRIGSTALYIKGHWKSLLPLNDVTTGMKPGRWMLLRTDPSDPGIAARRWLVRVISVKETQDPIFNEPITRLEWEAEQATPFDLDMTTLIIRGNLLPATAGRTFTRRFVVGKDANDPTLNLPEKVGQALRRAVERESSQFAQKEGSWQRKTTYLFSLEGSDDIPLCWLGHNEHNAVPEIQLREIHWDTNQNKWISGSQWQWRCSFLGVGSSQAYDRHYTLDDGIWKRVIAYRHHQSEVIHYDYATGEGKTLRFGDGEFGAIPSRGNIFEVNYRLGNGRTGNVAADTLIKFDSDALPFVDSVSNPLAAGNGDNAETPQQVRQFAPESFRATTYRAVRPEDYKEAAERLDWVQRAGASFRWTGSWLSCFVTPDPKAAVALTPGQSQDLAKQMDLFRQAGRETVISKTQYANIDLKVTVCVEPDFFPGEVKQRVLNALLGNEHQVGFFSPDNFTFGSYLFRSELETAIQQVPGVRAVDQIYIRRRGIFDWHELMEAYEPVGAQEVIRLENDSQHPGHGTLQVIAEGGA